MKWNVAEYLGHQIEEKNEGRRERALQKTRSTGRNVVSIPGVEQEEPDQFDDLTSSDGRCFTKIDVHLVTQHEVR